MDAARIPCCREVAAPPRTAIVSPEKRDETSRSRMRPPLGTRKEKKDAASSFGHRQHRVHDPLLQPRHADDAGPGVLLRRAGRAEERPRHHDPELRLHGLDDGPLVAFGFSMCFSGNLKAGPTLGIIGNFDWVFLRGITLNTPVAGNDTIPMFVFCAYQMMFAIITPALITGAFTNRVTFKAYMLFLTGWLLLVYFPFVHMVWGGGILASWGVLDFAGGIVVHNIAGIAALASVLYVGSGRSPTPAPTASRWSRSARACSGSAGTASTPAASFASTRSRAVAFLNTDLAASFAAIAWLAIDWSTRRSRSSSDCSPARSRGSPRSPRPPATSRRAPPPHRRAGGHRLLLRGRAEEPAGWDDALDVWGVHGVGGFLGIVLLGVFATTASTPTAPMACSMATRASSSSSSARSPFRRSGRSCSRSGCYGDQQDHPR